MFDPDSFASTVYDQSCSTKYTNVPPGAYNGMISKFTPREVQQKDGTKRLVIDLQWEVDDPLGAIAAATGRDKNFVRQTIFLDTTPEGNLDMGEGKNVQLGRVREALGQNKPGEPWSFQRLIGMPATFLVEHKLSGEEIYANVTRVAPLGEAVS